MTSVLLAVAIGTFVSVQSAGLPIGGATVTFIGASGNSLQSRTDDAGRATAPFAAVRVHVAAPGCTDRDEAAGAPAIVIVLDCAPLVIGSVRVATGAPESLHRLPVAAAVLDAHQIADSPADTGDALLRTLPGFDRDRSNSAFTNYGQLRVSFGGAGQDRGLVLVDGVPAQDGVGGQVDWAAYPTRDLTRAELLRGAGSALYGAGAIGGVLSLDTFGPSSDWRMPASGSLAMLVGSHARADLYARSGFTLARNVTGSASFSQQQLQYLDLPPDYSSPIDQPAQSQASMASLRVRFAPAPSSIFEYAYRGAWDYQQEGRPNYDYWRRLHQNSLQYAHSTAQSDLSLDYFVRNADVTNRADKWPTGPAGALRYTQDIATNESGLSGAWLVDAGESNVEVRGDARFVNGDAQQFGPTGALQSAGSGTQTIAGLAVQETLRGRRTQFVAGVRGDLVISSPSATTDRALSPRAALRYDLSSRLAFRVSDGAGFRAPFLNELLRSFQIGSVTYLPNPGLVPERSSSFSSGLDWTNDRSQLSLDFINTIVNNAIAFRTIGINKQMRSNFGQTQTDGETLVYHQAMGSCTRVSLAATSQYARVTRGDPQTVGKRLAYVPQASATLSLDDDGPVETGVDVSYMGQTYADDLNVQPLGAAIVLGAHLGIPLSGGARLLLGAENLAGARYLSSIDRYGPPAIISVGLSLPVGGEVSAPPCR